MELFTKILYIIVIIIVFGALTYFIFDSASGRVVKNQIISKQVALILDQAEINDVITIEHEENFKLAIEDQNVILKQGSSNSEKSSYFMPGSYSYPFYNINKIKITGTETKTVLSLEKNE